LPEHVGPNELLSESRRGHRTLINMEDSSLNKLEKRYASECEDEPPPPPAPAPAVCPDPSAKVPNWLKAVGVGVGVTAAVGCALAEPCGAIVIIGGGAAAAASH
jgi:hypothetical protein